MGVTSTFLVGSHVVVAYIGLPGWRATVIEHDRSVPGFETLTVRDGNGCTWGFACHRRKWYSAFGRRRVLIGAVEWEKATA